MADDVLTWEQALGTAPHVQGASNPPSAAWRPDWAARVDTTAVEAWRRRMNATAPGMYPEGKDYTREYLAAQQGYSSGPLAHTGTGNAVDIPNPFGWAAEKIKAGAEGLANLGADAAKTAGTAARGAWDTVLSAPGKLVGGIVGPLTTPLVLLLVGLVVVYLLVRRAERL